MMIADQEVTKEQYLHYHRVTIMYIFEIPAQTRFNVTSRNTIKDNLFSLSRSAKTYRRLGSNIRGSARSRNPGWT